MVVSVVSGCFATQFATQFVLKISSENGIMASNLEMLIDFKERGDIGGHRNK